MKISGNFAESSVGKSRNTPLSHSKHSWPNVNNALMGIMQTAL